jgi:hypothetical protein
VDEALKDILTCSVLQNMLSLTCVFLMLLLLLLLLHDREWLCCC